MHAKESKEKTTSPTNNQDGNAPCTDASPELGQEADQKTDA
jgi:hypothetical protein